MPTLPELIPNPDDLLSLPVEDLAPIVMRLARDCAQNGMVHIQAITNVPTASEHRYAHVARQRIDAHIAATWEWLRINGLLAPAPGINGTSGWMFITTKGQEVATTQDFARLKECNGFPQGPAAPGDS